MAESSTKPEPANWIMGGLAIVVGGAVLAAATYPSTEIDFLGELEETGNKAGFVAGLLVIALGEIVALIGVIAQGVSLGMQHFGWEDRQREESRRRDEALAARKAAAAEATQKPEPPYRDLPPKPSQ